MPDDDAVDGNSLLLSWLTSQFANINDFIGNQQGLERFARAWILRFIGGVMFVDKSSKKVPMRYLQFLRDLRECNTYADLLVSHAHLVSEFCWWNFIPSFVSAEFSRNKYVSSNYIFK